MAIDPAKRAALVERIDAIEDCYEFLLAFAAQGRLADSSSGPGSQVRGFLERADEAMDGLGAAVAACLADPKGGSSDPYRALVPVLDEDAKKARIAMGIVMAQAGISSQMVDNLNASIHVRALLTDIFLIDEALKITARLEAGT